MPVMPFCCGAATCCAADTTYKVSLPALTIAATAYDVGGGTATPGSGVTASNGNPGHLDGTCSLSGLDGNFMNAGTLDTGDGFDVHFNMWFVGKRMYVAIWSDAMTTGYATFDGPPDDDGNPTEVDHDPVDWPYTKGIILFYGFIDLDDCCQVSASIDNSLGTVGDTFTATGKVTRDCIIAATGGTMTVKIHCNSCANCQQALTQPSASVSHSGSGTAQVPTGSYAWNDYEILSGSGGCNWVWELSGVGADGGTHTFSLTLNYIPSSDSWNGTITDGDPDHGMYFLTISPDNITCVDGVLTGTFSLGNITTPSLSNTGGSMTVVLG